MFNNLKSVEFFNPQMECTAPIHVIGCGAIGGPVAEILARTGVKKLHIWDMDVVSPHNLGNQIYENSHIHKLKTTALSEILKRINPEIEIVEHGEITPETRITGYIFLCVDNIDTRRELTKAWLTNPNIKFITDGRMRLVEGYVYAADWRKMGQKDDFFASMQFTHEEALETTPQTACGITQSIVYTPRMLSALMVSNFVSYIKGKDYSKFILVDMSLPALDAYKA